MQQPVQGRLALDMSEAVQDGGGVMFAAGRWRWGITGPAGTIIIRSLIRPHRKLRGRIRDLTGVTLPSSRRET